MFWSVDLHLNTYIHKTQFQLSKVHAPKNILTSTFTVDTVNKFITCMQINSSQSVAVSLYTAS